MNGNDSPKVAAVTGARGLIGRYIVAALLELGCSVKVLSRCNEGWGECPRVQVIVSDINDPGVMEIFLEDAEIVFHCAAELHDESLMYSINVQGTTNIINALKMAESVKYFCYLSSAGVVGPSKDRLVYEQSVCYPNNLYEKTKYKAEQLVLQADLDINVCILRPANVFDASKLGLVQMGVRSSLKDRLLVGFRGNEGAHIVHAKDVAAAALYFMNKKLDQPEVFFVSYDQDERNTIKGVYAYICTLMTGRVVSSVVMPNIFPYLVRRIRLGESLHGRVRFSEKKLRESGFTFPLGFEGALKNICDESLDKKI